MAATVLFTASIGSSMNVQAAENDVNEAVQSDSPLCSADGLLVRVGSAARDADPAGDAAMASLCNRAEAAGIEPCVLSPCFDDFNDDLCRLGSEWLRASVRRQLAPQDVVRFLASAVTG